MTLLAHVEIVCIKPWVAVALQLIFHGQMVDKLELLFVEIPGSLLGGLEFSAGLNLLDNYAWPRFDHKGENIFQSRFPIYHELKLSIFGRPDNACQNLLNVLFIGIGQGCIVRVFTYYYLRFTLGINDFVIPSSRITVPQSIQLEAMKISELSYSYANLSIKL